MTCCTKYGNIVHYLSDSGVVLSIP